MAVFYEHGKKYNFRNPSGTPYYRKYVTLNGRRHIVYGDGEKDANRKIDELKALTNAGLDIDKKTAKVGQTFKYWLYNIKRVDKNIKASTFERYDGIYRIYVEKDPIGTGLLSELTSGRLQAYLTALYEERGVSGANITQVVKVWKMFSAWAVDEGYLLKNPCRNLSIPGKYDKSKRTIEVFSEEERKTIVNYMAESQYQYDTIILLAFATGMRQGELLGLRWADVDYKDSCIHVSHSTAVVTHIDKNGNRDRYREVWDTKTANSVRSIPILPSTAAMLKEHRLKQRKYFDAKGQRPPEFVFTTNTGELIDARSFGKSYLRMLARAGVPYRKFHTIRHTFATEAIRRGVDVKDLQMLMGHSDLSTTYIYVQSDMDSKRSAIELIGQIV